MRKVLLLAALLFHFGLGLAQAQDGYVGVVNGGGGGGGSGTVTSVTIATTGGGANTGTCTSTTSINCTLSTQELPKTIRTTGNYATTDGGALVNYNSASDQTPTLPAAATAGAGFYFDTCNIGTHAQTVTASGSDTIGGLGNTTDSLTTGTQPDFPCRKYVADGVSNWWALPYVSGSSSGVASLGNASADTSLTIAGTGSGPWTGAVTAKLNLGNAQTWTAAQTFTNGDFLLKGSSSGAMTLEAPAAASTYVMTFPAATDTVDVLGTAQAITAAKTFNTSDLIINGGSATLGLATVSAAGVISSTASPSVTGNATIESGTAVPSGGTQDIGYLFSSTAHFGVFFGTGAPTSSQAEGSLYLRSDNGTLYSNTNGTTGWTLLGGTGNALFGTATGNTSGDVVTMANTTTGVQDSGTALTALAPLASPTFTGTVTLPDTSTFGSTVALKTAVVTSANGAASTPGLQVQGSAYTGGSNATDLPQLLVSPSGTAAGTSWSTSGTTFGVNAVSGFAGNLLDVKVAGVTEFQITSGGSINMSGTSISENVATNGLTINTANVSSGTTKAGDLTVKPGSSSSGSSASAGNLLLTAGNASAGTGNGGNVVITAGTTAGGTAGTIQMVNLGSAAIGTAYLCWNSSGNIVSEDTTCTVSAMYAKTIIGDVTPSAASDALDKLRIGAPVWDYKAEYGNGVHVGLIADDVEKMDPRCAVYQDGKLKSYEDRCIIAYLVADRQKMKSEIEDLRRRVH
jgi:hypothetical protein